MRKTKPKLSRNDKELIGAEKRLRRRGWHLKPSWGQGVRQNEYLEFLLNCIRHTLEVGDREIGLKLEKEYYLWKEVPIKGGDWSAIWSRKKPKDMGKNKKPGEKIE